MSDEAVPASDPLVARLQRNDAADQAQRRAVSILGALVKGLPETDDLLLTAESRSAFQVLRDGNPEIYLVYRSAIRQKAGRHVTDLLDAYIGPPAPGAWRAIQFLTVNDLMAQLPTEWRVDRVLPARGLGDLYGEAGVAKSFLALDLSLSIARGVPFFDRESKPGRVLYIAAEGRMKHRVAAYLQHHGEADEDIGIRFVEQSLDLCGPTRDLEQIETKVKDYQPVLVVIDTLSRVTGGGDENSGQDMGRLIQSCRRIEEACGGMVLLLHHSGKDVSRGARGHSSLRAACDVEVEVIRGDNGVRVARVAKLRDAEDGGEFAFRLHHVRLGDGRSSCVVVPAAEADKPKRAERTLTATERLALDALREQIATTGQPLPETSSVPGGKSAVQAEEWRARFYARTAETVESDSRRKSFNRGKTGLLARKVIGAWGEWVWIW